MGQINRVAEDIPFACKIRSEIQSPVSDHHQPFFPGRVEYSDMAEKPPGAQGTFIIQVSSQELSCIELAFHQQTAFALLDKVQGQAGDLFPLASTPC